MRTDDFRDELYYQMTFLHAENLFKKGVICKEELSCFRTKMLKKYSPIISCLVG